MTEIEGQLLRLVGDGDERARPLLDTLRETKSDTTAAHNHSHVVVHFTTGHNTL